MQSPSISKVGTVASACSSSTSEQNTTDRDFKDCSEKDGSLGVDGDGEEVGAIENQVR